MSLKAKVEAIIYAAEEPITLEQMASLLRDTILADLASTKENAAIEKADADAEAHASGVPSDLVESTDIPELTSDAADNNGDANCPEEGPLMPESATAPDQPAEDNPASLSDAPVSPEESPSPDPAETQPETQSETTSQEYSPHASAPNADVPAGNTQDQQTPLSQESDSPVPSSTESTEQPAAESEPAASASVEAPETTSRKRQPKKTEQEIAEDKAVRTRLREILVELVTDYANEDRGMEIRQVAGGFRMATKPEHHDVVRAFAKSLKPPIRLSLAALETLAVIAYKQPVTGPEIADIRGVESASVLGTLLDRKLITTAGRKQVIGRPMQYKTSKDFLLRFGLNDVNELPSMEEFSQLASEGIEITPSEPNESLSLFEPEKSSAPTSESPDASQRVPHPSGEAGGWGSSATPEAPESPEPAPEVTSEAAPDAAQNAVSDETTDPQPQPEAESSNVPETEHPIGR